jgi:hypothetical protein
VLLGRLMAHVRELHEHRRTVDVVWRRALEASTAAVTAENHAVTVQRDLVAAMTDGAGQDKRSDLKAAREAATALLEAT